MTAPEIALALASIHNTHYIQTLVMHTQKVMHLITGVVAHACNLSSREAKTGRHCPEFEISVCYSKNPASQSYKARFH